MCFKQEPTSYRESERCDQGRLTTERLLAMRAEMTDVTVPFRRTEEAETCTWCDFKNICGR